MIHLQYFPVISSFKLLIEPSYVDLNTCVFYQKRAFLNRCPIAGANGLIKLTVPLVDGRNQKRPLKDVRILNEERWQRRHWRSILSSYNSSPWFYHFADSMAALFEQPVEYLVDWNLLCLEWLYQHLKLPVNFNMVSDPPSEPPVAGPSGHTTSLVVYRQVYQESIGFLPNLSVIDLLFCVGPAETLRLLRQP